jgi:hypothetical protein
MLDWFSWTNGFYLIGLILAGLATLMAAKYKALMKEVKDVSDSLQLAYSDGKLSKKEKEGIMKEALDVLKAIINLKWKLFKL